MTSLPTDFQYQAVRKPNGGPLSKPLESGGYDFLILDGESVMVEEYLDCSGNLSRRAIVNSIEHPSGLDQRDV